MNKEFITSIELMLAAFVGAFMSQALSLLLKDVSSGVNWIMFFITNAVFLLVLYYIIKGFSK